MMNVVLAAKSVYPYHPFGGVQKYVYNYAKYLLKEGIKVEIVAPYDNHHRKRTEMYEGIAYTFLPPSIYRYLEYPIGWMGVHLFSRTLAKYLSKIKFDLLHAFDMTAFQYLRKENRRPVITHTFTDNFLTNPISSRNPIKMILAGKSKNEDIKRKKIILSPYSDEDLKKQYWIQYKLKTKPMNDCFCKSDKVLFEADIFEKQINDIYQLDHGKSDVLPVGVDLDFIDQAINPGNIFIHREALGFQEDDIVLLTVNRLAADKGIDKIILTLEELVKISSKVKLVIVGSGYQEEEILKMVAEKNLSDYVRHFKDVPERDLYFYYKLADIYLSVFSYPGSSLSTLEAMACSLPIITTAQPWLVENNQNGVIIEDNDPENIQSAIMSLIENKQLREMGNASRKIVQQYHWSNIARKGIKQYEDVLKVSL